MRVIYNDLIPFKGFYAISLCGVVFVRREYAYLDGTRTFEVMMNHEAIHLAQQKELWYIGFFILYLIEWLYRLVFHTKTAYRGISFEVEARENERDMDYLHTRKRFAWIRRH